MKDKTMKRNGVFGSEEKPRTHPGVIALVLLFALAAIGVLALSFTHPYHFRENRQYLSRKASPMDFSFTEFSERWSEADLRERFPTTGVVCYDEQTDIGDKTCEFDITSHNGAPALMAIFFFDGDSLRAGMVDVPSWHHGKMRESLVKIYGEPSHARTTLNNDTLLESWHLENRGGLFYNVDRQTNPVMWSIVLWASPTHCRKIKCFAD